MLVFSFSSFSFFLTFSFSGWVSCSPLWVLFYLFSSIISLWYLICYKAFCCFLFYESLRLCLFLYVCIVDILRCLLIFFFFLIWFRIQLSVTSFYFFLCLSVCVSICFCLCVCIVYISYYYLFHYQVESLILAWCQISLILLKDLQVREILSKCEVSEEIRQPFLLAVILF